jgi:hypothetical protein
MVCLERIARCVTLEGPRTVSQQRFGGFLLGLSCTLTGVRGDADQQRLRSCRAFLFPDNTGTNHQVFVFRRAGHRATMTPQSSVSNFASPVIGQPGWEQLSSGGDSIKIYYALLFSLSSLGY